MHPKKPHTHTDPFRFPKLQEPIEKEMIDIGEQTFKNMIVGVTKIMVEQVKLKHK